MVKTNDYMMMMEEDGGGSAMAAAITTTAAFVDRVAKLTKAGGGGGQSVGGTAGAAEGGGGRGAALLMKMEECAINHPAGADWPPMSKSAVGHNKCSADFDESDESGGDHSGGSSHHHRMLGGGGGEHRVKFSPPADGNDLDDRRLRRQIANCNERRRMQSINAGFQSLRQLLPRKDGDKMSKAAILAATADFIQALLREKARLMEESTAVAMSKKRRLDTEDLKKESMTVDELPSNLLDCLRTIGDLRNSLQKETQLRMAYEKELLELRRSAASVNALPLSSPPVNSSDFSPNSSSSSANAFFSPKPTAAVTGSGGGLLVELARQHQQESLSNHPHLYRPTPLNPTDVQLLSSAIASLAKASPVAGGGTAPGAFHPLSNHHNINTAGSGAAPIGINHHHQAHEGGANKSSSSLFVSTTSGAVTAVAGDGANGGLLMVDREGQHRQQHGVTTADAAAQQATISQRNLQALVLAIRHLEGTNGGGTVAAPQNAPSSATPLATNKQQQPPHPMIAQPLHRLF